MSFRKPSESFSKLRVPEWVAEPSPEGEIANARKEAAEIEAQAMQTSEKVTIVLEEVDMTTRGNDGVWRHESEQNR